MNRKHVLVLVIVVIAISGGLVALSYNLQYTSSSTANVPLLVTVWTQPNSVPTYVNITASSLTSNSEHDAVEVVAQNNTSSVNIFETTYNYPVTYTTTRYLLLNLTAKVTVPNQCLSRYELTFEYANKSVSQSAFCFIDAEADEPYIAVIYTSSEVAASSCTLVLGICPSNVTFSLVPSLSSLNLSLFIAAFVIGTIITACVVYLMFCLLVGSARSKGKRKR